MFENLVKIIISLTEFGVNKVIIVDNEKKDISLNGVYQKLNLKQFYDFLDYYFRITRNWFDSMNNKYLDNQYIVNIKIIEKDNEYDLYINNYIPDNFESFLELIDKIN